MVYMVYMVNLPTRFIVSLLILATLGVPTGTADTADPDAHWILIDARTLEVVSLPVHGSSPVQACGGDAPTANYCETGEHETVWLHGFPSPFPAAATLESRLIHANGAQIFRCTYLQGENFDNCEVTGAPAPAQGPIYHDCYSYLPPTAGRIPGSPGPGEATGVPGGLGAWECLLVE